MLHIMSRVDNEVPPASGTVQSLWLGECLALTHEVDARSIEKGAGDRFIASRLPKTAKLHPCVTELRQKYWH